MNQKRRLRWVLIGGVALGLAGLLAFMFAPRPLDVETARVVVGPIAETVADQGSARVREAYVVSAPVSGRLERVELHVGDPVTAGRTAVAHIRPAASDLLDPRTRAGAEAAVTAAQAGVAAGEAQRERLAAEVRRSEQALSRLQALGDRGFASRQALDDALAEARAGRAALTAADA